MSAFTPAEGGADPRAAKRVLGLGEGPVVICVGRLCRQKDQDVLLRAWSPVHEQVPAYVPILLGDGPDGTDLACTVDERSGGGIRLVGWSEDIGPWYAASDVSVVASRWEVGLSLAAREALACGLSVVLTDHRATGRTSGRRRRVRPRVMSSVRKAGTPALRPSMTAARAALAAVRSPVAVGGDDALVDPPSRLDLDVGIVGE